MVLKDVFKRRARSGFTISDVHVGQTLPAAEVDLTFTYRRAEDWCGKPYSIWGPDQTCLLYFDFGIDEKGQKNLIEAAEVQIDFSESDCPQLSLTRVAPMHNAARNPVSEQTFRTGYTIAPTAETPFGGAGLGSYNRESEFEGLPDWRFRGVLDGNRPCKVAVWRWTRLEARYVKSSRLGCDFILFLTLAAISRSH